MNVEVTVTDNSEKVIQAINDGILRALERIGEQAEGYAIDLIKPDTGALRESITHIVDAENTTVYIGTNMEYGPYVELGTGAFAEKGDGRAGWWVYVPGQRSPDGAKVKKIYTYAEAARIMHFLRSKGLDAHMTQGQKPKPYLRPALNDHKQTYINILKDELENAPGVLDVTANL